MEVEYRIRLDDGTRKWLVSRGRPFFKANGDPERLVGLSMDITGQRKAEIEARELRNTLAHSDRVSLLGHLSSALAHELSQPLGAILRNAEAAKIMLGEPSPDLEELRAIVEDILRDDHRAGDVIDRLRSLLKRGSLNPQPVHLGELLGEVLSLLRGDAAARHVRVESSVAPDLPLVLGDRIHLQQVLINLLVNAMDALDGVAQDKRLVRVTVRRGNASAVEVEVADQGHGIAKEHLPRLFDAFFTTKASGMGIGLPVSKTIIEAHKGKLWAENNPEGGARFRFTVPVVSGAPISSGRSSSNTPPRPGSANPEPAREATVYVVDDDVSHLRSMARLLKASGFRVVMHNSAAELLAELRPDAPGCVVTDLMMPEMSGIDLQEALRRAGNPLPVVFLSGQGNVPTTVQAMKGGAEDFLTKNAPREDLLAAIGRALERNALDRTRTASLREKRSLFESLTDREREVLRHVLQGQLNKQIAADLGIHERTVKLHRTHLTTKLGVHSVAELSRLVQEAEIEL